MMLHDYRQLVQATLKPSTLWISGWVTQTILNSDKKTVTVTLVHFSIGVFWF